MIKSDMGMKGLTSSYYSKPIIGGSQDRSSCRAGTWRQELMQRSWGVLLTGLFSLLSYRTQDHQPRGGPTHNGLGPPHQLLIKKTLHRIAYKPIW